MGCDDPPIHEEEDRETTTKKADQDKEKKADQDKEDTTDAKEKVRTEGCAIANLDYLDYRDKTKRSTRKKREMCQGVINDEMEYPWFTHCCRYIENQPCTPYTGENPEPKGMIIYLLYLHVDIMIII